jgi:Tfp pilus assembly protein PilO
MAGAKKSTWIGGTVFLCLVLMVAAWFLAISPKKASAADVRAQTEAVEQQNDLLERKVAKLAADAKRLPELKKQLAALRVGIPSDAQLATYVRHLDAIAADHGVTIEAVTPAVPELVTVAAPTTSEPSPSPTATPSADASAKSSTDPADATTEKTPPPNPVPAGFTAVPLSVTVIGSFADTTAFVADLQRVSGRLFLVGGITATGQQDKDAIAGKPKTEVGDQELVISGFAYVLADPTAALPEPAPTGSTKLPKAPSGKDPYTPAKGDQ